MLKFVSIFATLAALGFGMANAQQIQTAHATQQEPSLTKLEVQGADFDIIICSIKPGANVDCGQPEHAGQWKTRVYLVPKGETPALSKR